MADIALELQQVGNSLKVSAIDMASGEEVSFVAPLSASRHSIEQLAAQKLRYKSQQKKVAPSDGSIIV